MSVTCERGEWEIGDAQNIPRFILHLQELDKMLATAGKISDSTLNACLEIWLQEFDRAEKTQLLQDTMQNKMHVYGMGLCVLASRYMGDNIWGQHKPTQLPSGRQAGTIHVKILPKTCVRE